MSYSISVDDVAGNFAGSFTFSNYCEDETIMNGSARFSGEMDVVTGEFIEANFSFDNLSGGELTLDGEIHVDFSASPNVITFNAYTQDPSSGLVCWVRNYIITIDEYAGFVEVEMAGTFYYPQYGYVTLSTADPFILHDGDEWPTSGELLVTGAGNSKARITAIDNLTCLVEADIDGDDVYEWDSGVMNWEDL